MASLAVGGLAALAMWRISDAKDILLAGIYAATLSALVWYAWETSRMVAGLRRNTEIDQHPWLSAANLNAREMDATELPPIGAEDIWLPIQNVGKTPAYDVEVDAECSVRSAETQQPVRYRAMVHDQVLVPNDTLHVQIAIALLTGLSTQMDVSATIRYTTASRGAGEVKVVFIFEKRGRKRDWRNGPTNYIVRLADGTKLSGSPGRGSIEQHAGAR